MSVEQDRHDNPLPYEWPPHMVATAPRSEAHQEVIDWLRANGVDTKNLPANPKASVRDGKLTLQRWVLGPGGKKMIAPDYEGFLTETITIPVVVPPSPLVEIWLAPKCSECGR